MDLERLQVELKARRRPGAALKRLRAAGGPLATLLGRGLPGELRKAVEAAVGPGDLYQRSGAAHEHEARIGPLFQALSDADRRRLVEALFPRMAESVNAAWERLALRPYQTGFTRKPFRAPRSPAMLAQARGHWLLNLALALGDFDEDAAWVAAWTPHLDAWFAADDIGWLLAGALDAGGHTGAEVFKVLRASAAGEHPVGQMGRHVVRACLCSGREDAWDFVEKLLLAAQRQEGLRQAVLESVDEAHPQAFRRMLRLIRDEDLARFSATVRALDTWFGFAWDGASALKADQVIDHVLTLLDDADARAAALAGGDAETAYLALWTTAFDDVDAAIPLAAGLLSAESPEIRYVGVHFLAQTGWSSSHSPLAGALSDADLRVAAQALDAFTRDATEHVDGARLFAGLEGLMQRLPKRSQTLPSIVWPWTARKLERTQVAAAMRVNARDMQVERLMPYVRDLDTWQREQFVRDATGLSAEWDGRRPGKRKALTAPVRALVLDLLGDPSESVRRTAFEALRPEPLLPDEVDRLAGLLDRKPGDLRGAALARLRGLDDDALLACAGRLVDDRDELRRLAGLELLRDAVSHGRAADRARRRVARFRNERVALSEPERAHVLAVLGDAHDEAKLDDALGLVDPAALPAWPAPARRRVELDTPAAKDAVESLAALVLAHQTVEVKGSGGEMQLLLDAGRYLHGPHTAAGAMEDEGALPLAEVWKGWLAGRGAAPRDADGLELLRAVMTARDGAAWKGASTRRLVGGQGWSPGESFLRALLGWCLWWQGPAEGAARFLADGLETALAALKDADFRAMAVEGQTGVGAFGYATPFGRQPAFQKAVMEADAWLNFFRWWRELFPASVPPAEEARVYGLLRWFQARSGGAGALQPVLDDVVGALRTGAVGEAELVDLLVGRFSQQPYLRLLHDLTPRKPPRELVENPVLAQVVDRCRRRIVEVECRRGDRPTAVSVLAGQLRWTGGLETLTQAFQALGTSRFTRGIGWGPASESRQDTLSHLVVRSTPREGDTPEVFAEWARRLAVKPARLVELAVYAPQWAGYVSHALDWPGLEDAVWWLQAHTRDDRSWSMPELKEAWAAEVSERTPLSAQELTEGAVDVPWFHATYSRLGAERWKVVETAAKYGSSAGGHTRAQLFARAMRGEVTRDELTARIDSSRHQDSVRALGLLPLAEGEAGRRDLLERWRLLQEFRRGSRKFGSQRQESEKRAVAVGMANLARTAGYRDPQRLQWAMEREAVGDLARGPLVLERGDLTVTLSIDENGVPHLTTQRAGKPLKSLPASLKKDAEAEELKERLTELRRQGSRVRGALEEAMCRGDAFTGAELRELLEHPVLAPALSRLVFLGEGAAAGYPVEGGRALADHAGALHAVGAQEPLRLAHPHDLLGRGDWTAWQRECFRAEQVQPFKQVFRELYPATEAEREGKGTRRYAGHQVQPRQALALLGGRGWVAHPEEGVHRTFHEQGLTVRLFFQEAFHTPAEIEGLTLEDVVFTKKGEWEPLPLAEVPPLAFSEAMRDLDLVVSVAHRGGVDPEASAGTVEMRAALLRETCELLGLRNVEVQGSHALVRGELASYAVHLGSAGARVMPGTALFIVAVHSQHRGRLFLPFADDDPKTAEVLSKVLLLARDRQIKDPNILDQIRATVPAPA